MEKSGLFKLTLGGAVVKNPLANTGDTRDTGSILGQKDPLEEERATHSSILD